MKSAAKRKRSDGDEWNRNIRVSSEAVTEDGKTEDGKGEDGKAASLPLAECIGAARSMLTLPYWRSRFSQRMVGVSAARIDRLLKDDQTAWEIAFKSADRRRHFVSHLQITWRVLMIVMRRWM